MQAHESFDPYVKWLGIRSAERPPNHYRLLGVELFEADPDVISHAADARIVHLRNFQAGPHRALAEKILEEIKTAKAALLDPEKKRAYDEQLRAVLAAAGAQVSSGPPVLPPPFPPETRMAPTGAWSHPVEGTTAPAEQSALHSGWASRSRTFWMVAFGVLVLVLLGASVAAVVASRRSGPSEIAEAEEPSPEETTPAEKGSSASGSLSETPALKEGGSGRADSPSASGSEKVSGSGEAQKVSVTSPSGGSEKSSSSAGSSDGAGPSKEEPKSAAKSEKSPAEMASETPAEKTSGEKSPPEKDAPAGESEKTVPPKESAASEKEKEKESSKPEEPTGKEEAPLQSAETPRRPAPSPEEQKRAEAMVRDLFKKELAEAKLPPEKLTLADKLLKEAIATQDDPAAAYVLFGLASGLAASAGDLRKGFEIIDAAGARFTINPISMKLEVLEKALNALRTAPQPALVAYELADLGLMVMEDAILADQIEQAAGAYKLASGIVKRSGDNELIQEIVGRNHCLQVFQKQSEAFRAAETKLASTPDDPAAHTVVGRWHCFLKGLWEKGLPHLARGQPEELASLAQSDLKSPEDPKEQFLLAERWMKYAASETEEAKGHIQLRAAYWYQRALPDLSGLDKLNAERQLEKLPTTPPLFTRRQRGEVVPGNVALEIAGAKVTGPNTSGSYLIDGRLSESYAAYGTSPCSWTITFPKLYSLREIRVLLVARFGYRPRHYGYILAVSTDGKRFTPLVDRNKGQWMGWQVISFPARPVRAIQLIGFRESGEREFSAVELEAYCVPPKYPPGTPSEPPPGAVSEDPPSVPRKKERPQEPAPQEEGHKEKKSRPKGPPRE